MTVDPCAHGGAALGQFVQGRQGALQPVDVVFDLGDIARKFLPQRQRGGILQVGAADFDDIGEVCGLVFQTALQIAQRGHQVARDGLGRRDVHDGGKGIVGRLPHVAVIVGVNGGFDTAGVAQAFVGAVGQHFVGIHVGLGARSRLPDGQGKLTGNGPTQHIIRRRHNGIRHRNGQQAQRLIHQRRRLFLDHQRANQFRRHFFNANGKIIQRPLRLRPPITVSGNLNRTKGVCFRAGLYHHGAFPFP